MIPRIIHYCWFGGNPMPPLAKKCIKSWHKYCKDYELREWNEQTFDISSAPLYVRQAYEAKKWAFITDYVRLYAMVNYGGVYMDTDVEVIKPLDQYLQHQAFSGFEDGVNIPTGIMACEKGFPLFATFLKYYDTASFYLEDGTMNLTSNVKIMTDICLKLGLQQNNTYQVLEGFALYPRDVFCPVSHKDGKLHKTKATATIHWFAGSWMNHKISGTRRQQVRYEKWEQAISFVLHSSNRICKRLLGDEKYESLKRRLK